MRQKVFILLAASIVLSMMMGGKAEQKRGWKGQVEEKNGVKTIRNPKAPLYGEVKLDLAEDLSIGKEDDKNYVFFRARGIQVDKIGDIFVLDRGNYRVQKFDQDGNYVQTIGKQGQGPGEFEAPLRFYLDAQDNLYVYDSQRIKAFNPQGEFVNSFPLEAFLGEYAVNQEGRVLGSATFYEGGAADRTARQVIITMNKEGKIERQIAAYSDFGPRIIITPTATRTLASNHEYRPRLFFASLDSDEFLYGYSADYEIIKIDSRGNVLLKIQKDEPYQPITRKEKDAIIKYTEEGAVRAGMKITRKDVEEVCHFRKYRTFFDGIFTDDRLRIYVRRIKPVLEKSKEIDLDIFSKDGYYLYKAQLPSVPEVIANGYLYCTETSEETGEIKIKRYLIKNWNSLKEM